MNPNITIIQSYVFHETGSFFVSTIERDSSAMDGPRRFNETIVWAWDKVTRQRGAMIHQDGESRGSIRTHLRICEAYHKTGKPPEESP